MESPNTSDRGSVVFLAVICLAASLGGFLFGFDTAVISGTNSFWEAEFKPTPVEAGWTASSAIVGCIIGASMAGVLSDHLGRKRSLILSAVLYFVSAVGCGFPQTMMQLVFFRLIGGVGVGICSLVSPLYIAEVSPPAMRGRLVSLQQLGIVLGILAAFFSNALILKLGFSPGATWRIMFAVEAVPALVFLLALFPVPESPRWLVQKGELASASAILGRIVGIEEAAREMAQISEVIREEEGSILELLQPGLRVALIIGIMLALLQQVSGINAIMYYGPKIFAKAGWTTQGALDDTVWIGVVNTVFTLGAFLVIDRFGRKPVLIVGNCGMAIALLLVGVFFATGYSGVGLLLAIMGYVAFFGASTGAATWVVISEIFPTRIRGRAASIATVALWIGCYAVSQTFPILIETIGPAKAFWIYAANCVATIVFVAIVVPETKGKSLEEIGRMWLRQARGMEVISR